MAGKGVVLLVLALVLQVLVEGASVCCSSDGREGSVEVEGMEVEPPQKEVVPRSSVIHPWPNATVPYTLWGSDTTKEKVQNALNSIAGNTCIKFKAWAGEARYLLVKEGSGGCWTSYLGYPHYDTKVTVSLGPGCVKPAKIKHEVMHVLGFPHEMSRPDRSHHVSVKWNNIKDGAKSQYAIDERYPTLEVPYDLYSIMHYGKYDCAKDSSKPTMVPSPWVEGRLGSDSLSYRDKRKVDVFYGCL